MGSDAEIFGKEQIQYLEGLAHRNGNVEIPDSLREEVNRWAVKNQEDIGRIDEKIYLSHSQFRNYVLNTFPSQENPFTIYLG